MKLMKSEKRARSSEPDLNCCRIKGKSGGTCFDHLEWCFILHANLIKLKSMVS